MYNFSVEENRLTEASEKNHVSLGTGYLVNCEDSEGNYFDIWSKYDKIERNSRGTKVADQGPA